ncbi:hypothetical protein HY025_00750 [Candidatus Daviesbacteria bacterium]|nr:hypothetical protein [Candidatus Daviesbacteria bacterium]
MRKFDPKKLYKLSKAIVIVITFIAWILTAMLSEDALGHKYSINKLKKCKEEEIYKNNVDLYFDCIGREIIVDNQIQKDFLTYLSIGIFLPVVFFGGFRLYKYLFPIKKPKKR